MKLLNFKSRPKFKPANELEKLLQKAAKSKGVQAKFCAELVKSDVFVVPLNRPAIRAGALAEDEKLQLMGYVRNDLFFIAFFSSEERVLEAGAVGMGALKLAAKDFFEITKGSYLVLNPACAYGKEFFPAEIACLLPESAV